MPNISRIKGNQTMKFGQLMECEMRNIFLEKSYTKCGKETSPRPFHEKLTLTRSPDQWSKVLYSLFLTCWWLSKYIETKLQPHFLHNFWRKIFLLLYSINWPNFIVCCLYFVRYLAICELQLLVNQVVTLWILKLNLSF